MKVVILAGGMGSRISEESERTPKPMITIGGKPIIWHIMKHYSYYGHNEFIICCGYKGYQLKEYFYNYYMHNADMTIDLCSANNIKFHGSKTESWKVTLVDTGLDTMTGGRMQQVSKYLEDQPFMMTYGDGLSNVNIEQLLKFHKGHGGIATVTAVQSAGRFGALNLTSDNIVSIFNEKPIDDQSWINGGFFVLEPEVLEFIDIPTSQVIFERQPMEKLVKQNELYAYKHTGFWKPMDTMKDRGELQEMWKSNPPWKVWHE